MTRLLLQGSSQWARVLAACLALSGSGIACRGNSDEAAPLERRFTLSGNIVSGPDAAGRLTVAHDAVEGFMPAMVMPFDTRGLPAGLGRDDRIQATLVVTGDRSWIEGLSVVRTVGAAAAGRRTPAAGLGTLVPNFRLRNQDDAPVTLHGLRGRVVLVTFIYTRCPLPDFCPRLMAQFVGVRRALEGRPDVWPKVHLLAVTMDPVFDTPAVLKAYGERSIPGRSPFAQWDLATGAETEIQAMARFFGLQSAQESGVISHSLVTGVVGADGRLVSILPAHAGASEAIRILADEVQKAGRH